MSLDVPQSSVVPLVLICLFMTALITFAANRSIKWMVHPMIGGKSNHGSTVVRHRPERDRLLGLGIPYSAGWPASFYCIAIVRIVGVPAGVLIPL